MYGVERLLSLAPTEFDAPKGLEAATRQTVAFYASAYHAFDFVRSSTANTLSAGDFARQETAIHARSRHRRKQSSGA
jgi:hypothetical protein